MDKRVVIIVVIAAATGLVGASVATDQFADAGPRSKVHFTETVSSSQDPGLGHEAHQMAVILAPNEGTIYDGSITFASSAPVQVAVLHEIGAADLKGQPVWTVDEKKTYAFSLVGTPSSAGAMDFTGAAVALHSDKPEEFAATVSIDGWIRGKPTEVILQSIETDREEPFASPYKANVKATIPMRAGLYDGDAVLYIITDSTDDELANEISDIQNWRVTHAPGIADTQDAIQETMQDVYAFTNGIEGGGLYGYQDEVFSTIPGEDSYSGLVQMVKVEWKKGQRASVLGSAADVLEAAEAGRINLDETGTMLNAPHITWPGGQMTTRAESDVTDEMKYGGGQVTAIDKEDMAVTFVAHRGWGPDGQTTYHIVTGAAPTSTAKVMGVPYLSDADALADGGTADLVRFKNGLKGPGAMGFQAGIAKAAGEEYTPLWRVHIAEWNDQDAAKTLETVRDIDSAKEEGLISVSMARPMNSAHIINSPVIDPFKDV